MRACSACDPVDGSSGPGALTARRTAHRSLLLRCARGLLLAAGLLFAACLPRPDGDAFGRVGPVHRGPIVLVTYSQLRADGVGYLGGPDWLTPRLDALAERAEIAERGVAASSSTPVALASLLTGVMPWQHGVLSHLEPTFDDALPTLATALGDLGYESYVQYTVASQIHSWGALRGFDDGGDLDLQAAERMLEGVGDGPRFVWIHLRRAEPSWVDLSREIDRLAFRPVPSRQQIDLLDLYPYADPDRPLPDDLRAAARELYMHQMVAADQELGRLLDALDRSGRRDEVLLAVTALHGVELGEHGQALWAQNLGRESIEVPLVVDFPDGWWAEHQRRTMPWGAPTELDRNTESKTGDAEPRLVAAPRLWTTLVAAAGGSPAPVHLPSLFDEAPGPATSVLYLGNGVNLHAAVFPADEHGLVAEQVTLETRFAEAEPEYYRALLAQVPGSRVRVDESPRRIFDRLRRAFLHAPILEGPAASWHMEQWTTARPGIRPVADPRDPAEQARAAAARAAFEEFLGDERVPAQRLRAPAPAAGTTAGETPPD